jgi:DNA primase
VRHTGRYTPPRGCQPLLAAHRKYLCSRGFDPDEIIATWGVQGIGVAPKLGWRLFIPIQYKGELVSWTTRAIGTSGLRYISASYTEEAISHKHLLYGIDMVAHAVAIVEGPTDAWGIGPGAVGTLGLSWTPEQVKLMTSFPVRVVCFDNTPNAQARARKLADILSLYPGETYRVCMSGKDPASSPKQEIREFRKRFLY